MEAILLAIYILIWPILALGTLSVIWVTTIRELRQSRNLQDVV